MFNRFHLSSRSRKQRRAVIMFKDAKVVPVTLESLRTCIGALETITDDKNLISERFRLVITELYYTPDDLLSSFNRASSLIVNEEEPNKMRYYPKVKRTVVEDWLWTNDEKTKIEWSIYMPLLIKSCKDFITYMEHSFESEGKGIGNYRLEQMYCSICDILSLGEVFFSLSALSNK